MLAVLATRIERGRVVFFALASVSTIVLAGGAFLRMRGAGGFATDPLLSEVRYLASRLGPKDVVLTPGCPFPEMHYLAPMNLVEVRTSIVEASWCDVPHACVDHTLRDRVDWWTANGSRVLLALGDDVTDFGGKDTGPDASGAEKRRQIFWDPRLAARERAPRLAALRAAFDATGLALGSVITSPGGERYAEVQPRDRAAGVRPVAARWMAADLRAAMGDDDPNRSYRARILAEMAAALPDDPWRGCDVMQLACETGASGNGAPSCAAVSGCSCDPSGTAAAPRTAPATTTPSLAP
jgi:hypothetical protein